MHTLLHFEWILYDPKFGYQYLHRLNSKDVRVVHNENAS